jgi:hypothetical protein
LYAIQQYDSIAIVSICPFKTFCLTHTYTGYLILTITGTKIKHIPLILILTLNLTLALTGTKNTRIPVTSS